MDYFYRFSSLEKFLHHGSDVLFNQLRNQYFLGFILVLCWLGQNNFDLIPYQPLISFNN